MIETRFLDVAGLSTRTLVAEPGSPAGMPVLALHGWGASSDLMKPVAERLSARGVTVHAPDLPGFGQTGLPPSTWSVPEYARWTAAYCDAAGLDRVIVIGHSFGGRIAIMLGAEYGARIDRLVLVDSAGVPPKQSPVVQSRTRMYKAVRGGLHRIGAHGTADGLRQWYADRYGSADYAAAGPLREVFVRVVNLDLTPYAARITAPTLLIWGERDEDTPRDQAETLERLIRDSGLVILKGAGHYSYLECLDEFITIVDHFIRH